MSGILLATVGNSYGSAPVNTVAPAVTGTATVGQTLSTTNGTWTGAPAPTFTYQWQRVTTNISGATSSTYVLVAADVGNTIRCVVTATNSIAPSGVSANSNSTASVAAGVPDAPTIGTATATGTTTATVVYTAPASDGGATITSYTATSSPSGITGTLSQAGSGTITVSGLAPTTSYTFTVTATNSAGTSAASAASNSITTQTPVVGQQAFTTAGTYSWVAPTGVTKVSVVAVGVGGWYNNSASRNGGGGGGGLGWRNNISVTPGSSYSVIVGAEVGANSCGTPSSFAGATYGYGGGQASSCGTGGVGGGYLGDGGGYGGAGGSTGGTGGANGASFGGSGGYTGAGGAGANQGTANGGDGAGGGGGGGASRTGAGGNYGGNVGILGQGANGAGGRSNICCCPYGQSGSGGRAGANFSVSKGAVRIIWPGCSRSFPSTCTGDK